jgi:hypothetical protein
MARRKRSSRTDPFADLAQKSALLERELTVQREALAKLKEMATRCDKSATAPPRRPA